MSETKYTEQNLQYLSPPIVLTENNRYLPSRTKKSNSNGTNYIAAILLVFILLILLGIILGFFIKKRKRVQQ